MKFEILIVDDEPLILEQSKFLLEVNGKKVASFLHPKEAVEYLRINHKKICLIISDYKMPELNGFEFKELISREAKDAMPIPFVILTGFFDKEMAVTGMSLGVLAFIDKPVRENELFAIIEKAEAQKLSLLQDEISMVESFIDESSPMLEDIEGLILGLEENPNDLEILNTYFRYLHTIKGTASCVGLTKVAEYSHKYEDYISDMRQGKFYAGPEVISILLKGLDQLKECFARVRENWDDINLEPLEMAKIFKEKIEVSEKLDRATSPQETQASPAKTEPSAAEQEDKITVSMDLLDRFMEMSGELTVIRNSIVKTVKSIEHKHRGDTDLDRLNDLLSGMNKITSVMQGQVSDLRKVPIKTVFRPMKRLVRDVSNELEKEVELIVEGEDLLVDNQIAKVLNNCLVHLLRNSLDHGLETKEERVKTTKNAKGLISLKVFIRGEDIVLEIKDDGRGIDPEIIKNKSIEKGLYQASDFEQMNRDDILAIIFEAGFSTAKVVSDLSGRGVGMDMVKRSIEGTGGKILIESEVGQGTVFHLVVPIPKSVLIINSLLMMSSGHTFVIPTDVIAEVLSFNQDEIGHHILKIEEGYVLSYKDELYPLINLSEVLKTGGEKNYASLDNLFVVIVKFRKTNYALVVDQIDEFEDVVIKNISHKIQMEGIFRGASLLGNGSLALILDVDGIGHHQHIEQKNIKKIAENKTKDENNSEYLLFSIGNSSPFCVPLSVVNRLEKFSGSKVEFSAENMVVQYRSGSLPLFDLGALVLEKNSTLASEVSHREFIDVIVIEKEQKLFGLIVDKIEDIGFGRGNLNTDIMAVNGALGTILIDEKLVTVLDASSLVYYQKQSQFEAEAS